MEKARIEQLCTYPIKGFSPHCLEKVNLKAGGVFPRDRAYALKRGDWHFDENDPGYHLKTKFYMLLLDEKIAELKPRFSLEELTVAFTTADGKGWKFSLSTRPGRAGLEKFLSAFLNPEEALSVVTAGDHSMSDVPIRVASIINLASVQDLADKMAKNVDPIRFRGNIYFSGVAPWEEFSWVGKTLKIGTTEFTVTKPIERCKATHVDPKTGLRDLGVVPALHHHFGHFDMGIYAQVTGAGETRLGDRIIVL